MKKLLLILTLGLTALCYAQEALNVQETSVTAKAILPAASAGELMKNAVMERGQISTRLIGTNKFITITGMASITIPVEAAGLIVTVPDGYEASQLKNGSFAKGTNGIVVTVTFAK